MRYMKSFSIYLNLSGLYLTKLVKTNSFYRKVLSINKESLMIIFVIIGFSFVLKLSVVQNESLRIFQRLIQCTKIKKIISIKKYRKPLFLHLVLFVFLKTNLKF